MSGTKEDGGPGPASAEPPQTNPFDREENKRYEDRAAIQLRVDYKRLNTFFADYAKNISKGGTFIRTSKPLAAGTEFVFLLSIPERSDPIELRGEVIWTVAAEQGTEEAPAGMGIRFKFDGPDERETLERYVESLMAEKLGN